jgi:Domain of unknown function (DUF4873)
MGAHEAGEGYEGEVTVSADGGPARTGAAALAARFDPLAGHVVWSGRVDVPLPPRTTFDLTTPHGAARAVATETDAWGNTRLTGLGRPPFPVELLDGAAGA